MPNGVRLRLPEVVVPGKRLGRHVAHDVRSLSYLVPEGAPATTSWHRLSPILDQGNLGSCTGNAMVGCLGSEPYNAAVPKDVTLDEALAVRVYSLATQLDSFDGTYPPDDSGSDGNSAAKACRQLGLASGWTHATNLAACWTLIAQGPFAVGVSWYDGMDNPSSEGVVHATGQVRGGHEFEILNYDAGKGLWECVNSWGDSWAKGGHFYIPDADFARLLAEQGDATQLTPAVLPAPTPTPPPAPPAPGPNAYPAPEFEAFRAAFEAYDKHPYSDGKTGAMRIAARLHIAADDEWLGRSS